MDRQRGPYRKTFQQQLREAIRHCGQSRYAIFKVTGVPESTLCRFMGGASMSLKNIDLVMKHLGLVLAKKGDQP